MKENLKLGLADALNWMGDLPIDQTRETTGLRLSGTYSGTMIQALTANVTWIF